MDEDRSCGIGFGSVWIWWIIIIVVIILLVCPWIFDNGIGCNKKSRTDQE